MKMRGLLEMSRYQRHLICLAAVGLTACSSSPLPTSPGLVQGPDAAAAHILNLPDEVWRGSTPAAISVGAGSAIGIRPTEGAAAARPGLPQVTERTIGPSGGSLIGISADLSTVAHFSIPRRALQSPETIRMEIIGSGPAVQIRFGPSGLQFLRDCTLTIAIPAEGVEQEELGGYLLTEEGSTEVPATVIRFGAYYFIRLTISHFSLYSPTDGDDQYGDPGPGSYYWP